MNIYELHKYAKHNYTKWSLKQNDLYARIKQNGKRTGENRCFDKENEKIDV